MDRLQIERVGGLAGFGGPHLKSKGEVAISALSPQDRAAVDALFAGNRRASPEHPGAADRFQYRLTRQTASGSETVEVPESSIPPALRSVVRDTLE